MTSSCIGAIVVSFPKQNENEYFFIPKVGENGLAQVSAFGNLWSVGEKRLFEILNCHLALLHYCQNCATDLNQVGGYNVRTGPAPKSSQGR